MNASTARRRAAPLVMLATVLLPATALLALHFQDGPPASVTGGFGEDSCLACHAGNAQNDDAGKLALAGFPDRYMAGATYDFELTLSRKPALAAAGFQLAIRHADKTQAGTIRVSADDEARIGLLDERGVQFAHHLVAQAAPAATETVRWKLSWIAPEPTTGPVTVNAAAVAGDGDESQAGDYVYTLEATAAPAGNTSKGDGPL